MKGGGNKKVKKDEDEEEKEKEEAGNITRPRTVGRLEVQVFRNVIPKASIDLLMKGEGSQSRNPWPGIKNLLKTFCKRTVAANFRHPYIAEISSRCDSVGPPQRLDLLLTPSGVRGLLTPQAISAVEVRRCTLV